MAMVIVAAGFTLWANHQFVSLAGAVFFVVVPAALVLSGRLVSRQSRCLVALAPLFGVWLGTRSSSWLIPLDVIVASGLLVLGVATSSEGNLGRYGLRDLLILPLHLGRQVGDSAGFVVRALPADAAERGRRHAAAVAVGLALAMPIVIVAGSLLASGDRAFADLMNGIFGGSFVDQLVLAAVGAAGGLVLVRVAAGRDARPRAAMTPLVGAVEALTVLGSMVVIYGLFAVAQVIGSVAPAGDVLASAGETADWVHRGFFPLLWASAITLGVVITLSVIARAESERRRRAVVLATATLVCLNLVVVGVALHRIAGYSEVFGLTMLRLYSFLFTCWVGLVFVAVAVRALGVGADRRWFAGTCAGLGLMVLLALNVANPEARVIEHQIADLTRFDENYLLTGLSDDAVPALIDAVGEMPDDVRRAVTQRLCATADSSAPDTALGGNLSRSAARSALAELCA